MANKKIKKQVDRFKAGLNKFVDAFQVIVGAEVIERKENARGGKTTITVELKPTKDGLPATRAAKIGTKMAAHFAAWFAPTHYERYDKVEVKYKRGQGTIIIEGKI